MSQSVTTEHYPLPPEELRWRSTGMRDVDGFLQSSGIDANFLEKEVLARDSKSFKDFNLILDFGCGCGRLIRSLRPLCDPWATIQGVDIDLAAMKWCKENIADAIFSVNGEHPPLPFADKSFDLISACAVFTHMDADRQFRWLAELQRVLKPGGYLLATFRHKHAYQIDDQTVRERILNDLNRYGIAFMTNDAWKGVFPAWYGETYHAPEYIRKNWGSYFEVRHVVTTTGAIAEETAVLRPRDSTFLQRVFKRP